MKYNIKQSRWNSNAWIMSPKNPLQVYQTVEDILVGVHTKPADASYYYEFYLKSNPEVAIVHFPLNMRATFRWVPPPGGEIHLKPGDELRVRYKTLGLVITAPVPDICTRGKSAGRTVVDQQVYEQSLIIGGVHSLDE